MVDTDRALGTLLGGVGGAVAVLPNLPDFPIHLQAPLDSAVFVAGFAIAGIGYLVYAGDDGIDPENAAATITFAVGAGIALAGPTVTTGAAGTLAAGIGAAVALVGFLWARRLHGDADELAADERLAQINARAAHRSWQLVLFLAGSLALALLYTDATLDAGLVPVLVAIVLVGIASKSVLYGYYTTKH